MLCPQCMSPKVIHPYWGMRCPKCDPPFKPLPEGITIYARRDGSVTIVNSNQHIDALKAVIDELPAKPSDLSTLTQLQTELEQARQRIAVLTAERQTLRSALTNIAVLPVYELDIAYSIANAALEQTDAT